MPRTVSSPTSKICPGAMSTSVASAMVIVMTSEPTSEDEYPAFGHVEGRVDALGGRLRFGPWHQPSDEVVADGSLVGQVVERRVPGFELDLVEVAPDHVGRDLGVEGDVSDLVDVSQLRRVVAAVGAGDEKTARPQHSPGLGDGGFGIGQVVQHPE